MKLERRKYSERELAQFAENVTQAEADMRVAASQLEIAKDAHKQRMAELARAKSETEVIEKIESLGLNHRVVQLVEETYVRVAGVESLCHKNRYTSRMFAKLSKFVRQGEGPTWYNDTATVLDQEHALLQWCYGLLDNDNTQMGADLKDAVRVHYREVRERWLEE